MLHFHFQSQLIKCFVLLIPLGFSFLLDAVIHDKLGNAPVTNRCTSKATTGYFIFISMYILKKYQCLNSFTFLIWSFTSSVLMGIRRRHHRVFSFNVYRVWKKAWRCITSWSRGTCIDCPLSINKQKIINTDKKNHMNDKRLHFKRIQNLFHFTTKTVCCTLFTEVKAIREKQNMRGHECKPLHSIFWPYTTDPCHWMWFKEICGDKKEMSYRWHVCHYHLENNRGVTPPPRYLEMSPSSSLCLLRILINAHMLYMHADRFEHTQSPSTL